MNFRQYIPNIFTRPLPSKVPNPHNPRGLKLLTRLLLDLGHLGDHKFKHNFLDIVNPLNSCDFDIETTSLQPKPFGRKNNPSVRNF